MLRHENLIVSNLLYNDTYARLVIPNTSLRYFDDKYDNLIVKSIMDFYNTYGKLPTKKILAIELSKSKAISDGDVHTLAEYLQNIEKPDQETDFDWLVKETEAFYKKKAIYNAILDSLMIVDGKDKHQNEDAIPSILSEALAVTFDKSVGHDYIGNIEERYEFYHRKENKIPLDIDLLNRITKGGLSKKTLSIFAAGTGVGKSLTMCHLSSACIKMGYNVLYISMEMSEEKIAERLDVNLMNMDVDDLHSIDKKQFINRFKSVTNDSYGKMIIKEYPTCGAHVGHFKALLNELWMKKKFKPDIVFIDYLNICGSQRIKASSGANSYTLVKSIAEELRGLAVEFDVPVVSATQFNKEGMSSSDPELTNTSESMGLTHTADLMLALISTEELEKQNQIMIKQLKNRYSDLNKNKRFVVGIARDRMRIFNAEPSAQNGIVGSGYTEIVSSNKSSASKYSNVNVSLEEDEDDDIPVFDLCQE